MRNFTLSAVLGLVIATPALPQYRPPDGGARTSLGAAADMAPPGYILDPVAPKSPSEILGILRSLGYSNFHNLDQGRRYRVEAITPDGEEVVIEIDPVTGAILDIEERPF